MDVMDLGTGQGHAIHVTARAFSNSHSLGLDFSDEGIEAARAEAASWKLSNARFRVVDNTAGPPGRFDLVTASDVVHECTKPQVVLAQIAHALRPKGVFLMMHMAASSRLEENLDHPIGPLLDGASVMHCMTVSLAQGGEGRGTMWGEQRA
jgi:2-polyprenyl-3-methyl-5-hydroxy-6-metoxy-1,4-benzoquinol methylase